MLCAPNAFKGTVTAAAAAQALAAGAREAGADALVLPMADGGDGTLDILSAGSEMLRIERLTVTGPSGDAVAARLGWPEPATALVELAEAAGLRQLHGALDPLGATSRGVGELIVRALDGSARRLLVGLGGSACTDGGAGLMAALGVRLLDEEGRQVPPGGGGLTRLHRIDASAIDPRFSECPLEVGVDVESPLLGPTGAASVFGPQKGAGPLEVEILERGLERLASLMERDVGVSPELRERPGTGAAGGCAYALAALGGHLTSGAALVADAVGIDAAISGCDLVITGEGRLDHQTAAGKAPIEVARRAVRLGVPCIAVAGSVESVPAPILAALSLAELAGPGEDPMTFAELLLRRAGRLAVLRWAAGAQAREIGPGAES